MAYYTQTMIFSLDDLHISSEILTLVIALTNKLYGVGHPLSMSWQFGESNLFRTSCGNWTARILFDPKIITWIPRFNLHLENLFVDYGYTSVWIYTTAWSPIASHLTMAHSSWLLMISPSFSQGLGARLSCPSEHDLKEPVFTYNSHSRITWQISILTRDFLWIIKGFSPETYP